MVKADASFAVQLADRRVLGYAGTGEEGQSSVLGGPDLVDQLQACVGVAHINIALGDHQGCLFPGGSNRNCSLIIFCAIEAAVLGVDDTVSGPKLDTAATDVDDLTAGIGLESLGKSIVTGLDVLDESFAHTGQGAALNRDPFEWVKDKSAEGGQVIYAAWRFAPLKGEVALLHTLVGKVQD